MTKTLVIYYSRTGENYVDGSVKVLDKGNTAAVAQMIARTVDADLFEVRTVKPYPSYYYACIDLAEQELRYKSRPALVAKLENVAGYDNVVVAGPCWWDTYPMAIFTQLEALDFAGKRVFPVMTHEGAGLAGSARALRQACPGAEVGPGLAVLGASVGESGDVVAKWAKDNLA